MKRLLSAVLVLLVGVVPMAAVANQERVPVEHLLWDIPFGIGVEECLELVRERAGVELGPAYSFRSRERDTYRAEADVDQGMIFFNYPASLVA